MLLQHGAVQVKSFGAGAPPLGIHLHHGRSLDRSRDGKRNCGVSLRCDCESMLRVRVSLSRQFQQLELVGHVADAEAGTTQAQRLVVPAARCERNKWIAKAKNNKGSIKV